MLTEVYATVRLDGVEQVGKSLSKITASPLHFAASLQGALINTLVLVADGRLLYIREICETVGYRTSDGKCEIWGRTGDNPVRWLSVSLSSTPIAAYCRDPYADQEQEQDCDNYF